MSHCPDCSKEIDNLAKGNATARHAFSAATVWECPHCGLILGVSDNG